MVRVLAVADEVAEPIYNVAVRQLEPELVLAAGDLPWDYLEFLSSALDVPVVFVPGNHDPELPSVRDSRWGIWSASGRWSDAPRPHGAINADRRIVTAAGLRIAGLGGCVRYKDGPNQYTQRQFTRHIRKLERQALCEAPLDVLLTHTPPRNLGDGGNDDPVHQGIDALPGFIERVQPRWQLHGHVHPYGFEKPDRELGQTTIRNVIPYVMMEIAPQSAHGPSSGARPTH